MRTFPAKLIRANAYLLNIHYLQKGRFKILSVTNKITMVILLVTDKILYKEIDNRSYWILLTPGTKWQNWVKFMLRKTSFLILGPI